MLCKGLILSHHSCCPFYGISQSVVNQLFILLSLKKSEVLFRGLRPASGCAGTKSSFEERYFGEEDDTGRGMEEKGGEVDASVFNYDC